MKINEALAEGIADLKAGDIDSPSLDVSLLLAHVLNTTRTALLAHGTDALDNDTLFAFRALIQRRLNGECAAYILGKKEFRGLEFLVNKSVLVPRPETETLVETAVNILNKKNKNAETIRVLDLCTGSGAIAVSIKNEMPEADVWATDISEQALETAKTNAARLLPDSAIHFLQGDLFKALSDNALPFNELPDNTLIGKAQSSLRFSVIASNPPYIPTEEIKTLAPEVQNEPLIALDGGHTGLEIINRIIEDAPDYLTKNGALLMETAGIKQTEKIAVLLEKRGFININIYKDLSGQERVIEGIYEE
jgi:release factor glutamine methyltransferase